MTIQLLWEFMMAAPSIISRVQMIHAVVGYRKTAPRIRPLLALWSRIVGRKAI